MPDLSPAALLERLVSIPSPTGSEGAAVAFLQDEARSDGFRVRTDTAGNFLAEAGKGPRTAWFAGHVDTVPGHVPVRVAGGELWGRGAVDAKGPLVAAYCAARGRLDGDLRVLVAGCVAEEGDSRGAKALPRDAASAPGALLVGEPSGADGITVGYKGILRGAFAARGPVQHGGHPGAGAADRLVAWWSAARRRLAMAEGFEAVSGRLDSLASRSDGLGEEATARFQVRLPPGVTPEAVQAALEELARGLGEVAIDESMPPALASERSVLVAHLRASIRAAGLTPRLKRKTGTADFNHFAQWFPGVPLAAYGPGDARLDHTPHERISLAELEKGTAVLEDVFARLAGGPALVTPSPVSPSP